jgi:hypothetical protein
MHIAGQDLYLFRQVLSNILCPHTAYGDALDAPAIACHQWLFDHWNCTYNTGGLLRLRNDIAPIGETPPIALHHRMTIKSDRLVKQFGPKTIHDTHHNDQHGHTQHHGDEAKTGDKEDEGFSAARQQIALGNKALIRAQYHGDMPYRDDILLASEGFSFDSPSM